MKKTTKWISVQLLALLPSVAFAYEPPQGPARTDFGGALMVCNPTLKASPGEVGDRAYHEYVSKRDKALKADPKLPEWDKPYMGMVPNETFVKCEKQMADYAKGVDADKVPQLAPQCENNVSSRLDSIIDKYHPNFEKNGPEKSIVWFARKDLEGARYYMWQKDGYQVGGATCDMNDPHKAAFKPLKEKFAKAEKLVKQMEKTKGVKFKGVENGNHIVYLDAKTKQPVPKSDAI